MSLQPAQRGKKDNASSVSGTLLSTCYLGQFCGCLECFANVGQAGDHTVAARATDRNDATRIRPIVIPHSSSVLLEGQTAKLGRRLTPVSDIFQRR